MTRVQLLRFMHIVNSANQTLVESRCMACGSLVAAGKHKKYLEIAESAHQCPGPLSFQSRTKRGVAQRSGAFVARY